MLPETGDLANPADETDELLEQIRNRGNQLIDEFEKVRSQDLESILPDLIALRDDQQKVIELLEKLREDDPVN